MRLCLLSLFLCAAIAYSQTLDTQIQEQRALIATMRKRPADFDNTAVSRQVTHLRELLLQRVAELQQESAAGTDTARKSLADSQIKLLQVELAGLPQPAPASPTPVNTPPPAKTSDIAMYGTFALMGVYILGGGIWTIRILRRSYQWSLSGALSEDGLPSSSRLIAFLGSQVTLAVLAGAGCYAIWALFTKDTLPSLSPLLAFAAGGMTLFTPYMANQIGGAVASTTVVPGVPPAQPPGAAALSLVIISPATIPSGSAQTVTLVGTGFQTGMLATLLTAAGTSAGSVSAPQLVNPTQATVTVTASSPGPCSLVLSSGGVQAAKPLTVT